MALKFGTSGIRGTDEDLDDIGCYAFTKAFLGYLKETGHIKDRIAIAGDLRDSTDSILRAVASAIYDDNCTPVYCGKIPTPALVFYSINENIPSIMITGSHIPSGMNGIKLHLPHGEILKSDEKRILEIYSSVSRPENIILKDLPEENKDAIGLYIRRYTDFFGKGSFHGKKIVVYEQSSVLRDYLVDILERLGAQVIAAGRSDKFVSFDTEAVEDDVLETVKRLAAAHKPDAIMTSDGDGDRALLFDESGNMIRGDVLGILVSMFLEADFVAIPVSCNTGIEKTRQFEVRRTKIGSPYVIEAMKDAEGFEKIVSYEANGGYIIGTDIEVDGKKLEALPTRDALIALLSPVMMAIRKDTSLSGLVADLPDRFTYSHRIKDFHPEKSKQVLRHLEEDAEKFLGLFGIEKVDRTDGYRMHFTNEEIVHIRPSSNAPELRCYCEAESEKRAKEFTEYVLGIINEKT